MIHAYMQCICTCICKKIKSSFITSVLLQRISVYTLIKTKIRQYKCVDDYSVQNINMNWSSNSLFNLIK